MAELTANCPRCGAQHTTFIVAADITVDYRSGWQRIYEAFCICLACQKATIFVLNDASREAGALFKREKGIATFSGGLNKLVRIERYISIADRTVSPPPAHLPKPINDAFVEGAKCFSIGCFNASAAMFRLCLDMATTDLLPKDESKGPPAKTRRSLGLRLQWLLDNTILPEALRELSTCIKEDGNDGAHEGTLDKKDAEDIQDFTYILLERLYTEAERVRLATERRNARRLQ